MANNFISSVIKKLTKSTASSTLDNNLDNLVEQNISSSEIQQALISQGSSATFYKITDIYTSNITRSGFNYEKGDGLDLLLKNGLRNLLKNASNYVQQNLDQEEFYLYIQFNDKNKIYQPLANFDNFIISSHLYSKRDITKKNIHSSRLVPLTSWRTKELSLALRLACLLVDTSYQLLIEQGRNSKILIYKTGDQSKPTQSGYRSQTESERQQVDELLKTLKKNSIFAIYEDESITALDLKIENLEACTRWSVKFLSFVSGISAVRLGFEQAQENTDINDDFIQNLNYINEIFTAPLINSLLDICHLKSEWSFKPISIINIKEQLEAEESLAKAIEKYFLRLTPELKIDEPELYNAVKNKIQSLLNKEL